MVPASRDYRSQLSLGCVLVRRPPHNGAISFEALVRIAWAPILFQICRLLATDTGRGVSSHCEVAVLLELSHAGLDTAELASRSRNAAQLFLNGVLPCVLKTPAASSCCPVWNQTVEAVGAPSLPVVGETQVSSQPLGGRHLVLVVTVKSADGQSGVAVVSGIQASASMQQWYLLVDPHTDQHMTSKSGQSSAVHLRIDYRHVRSDLRRSSAVDDLQSPSHSPVYDADTPRASIDGTSATKNPPCSAPSARMPTLIRPAQMGVLQTSWIVDVPSHYSTYDADMVEGQHGAQTLRLVPHVPAKPIFIRSCSSTADDLITFEIVGVTDSISVTSCRRIRLVAAMVLNTVNVTTCEEVELVLGGEAPRIILSGVRDCVVTLHKEKWKGNIECLASSSISVHAVEQGEANTFSLQEALSVERVLLPGTLQTVVDEGRMTTQCHFRHLEPDRQEDFLGMPNCQGIADTLCLLPPSHANPSALSGNLAGKAGPSKIGRYGVGLLLRKLENGQMQVANIADGGPAHKDGSVQVGDLLVAINGVSANGRRLREIGEDLLGDLGTEVEITLQQHNPNNAHDAQDLEKQVVLRRGPILSSDFVPPSTGFFLQGPSAQLSLRPLAPRWSNSAVQDHEVEDSNRSTWDLRGSTSSNPDLDGRLRDAKTRIEEALANIILDNMPAGNVPNVGVGLSVKAAADGAYRVSGLVSGGAADASGQIAAGDVLHSVDGINVCFKSHDVVKKMVQGPLGSRVLLSFLSPEALPGDLDKSVNEFDHWRPVILERCSNPSGYETPKLDVSQDCTQEQIPVVELKRDAFRLAPPHAPVDVKRRQEETIGLTLYLDEDFNTLGRTEADRQAVCFDLALDLSTSLGAHPSRIEVVDLLPGSMLADVHVHPGTSLADLRGPERLAAEIAVMVVDPQSSLRKSNTARHAVRTEIRGPVSQILSLRESRVHSQQRCLLQYSKDSIGLGLTSGLSSCLQPQNSSTSSRCEDRPLVLPEYQTMTSLSMEDSFHPSSNQGSSSTVALDNKPELPFGYSKLAPDLQNQQHPSSMPDSFGSIYAPYDDVAPSEPDTSTDQRLQTHNKEMKMLQQQQDRAGEERGLNSGATTGTDLDVLNFSLPANPPSVLITMKLRLNIASAGPEGSQQRTEFVYDLTRDLAYASGLRPPNFRVKSLSPGSIIVVTEVLAASVGRLSLIDLEMVAKDLQNQAHDPRSPLHSGAITRFVETFDLGDRSTTKSGSKVPSFIPAKSSSFCSPLRAHSTITNSPPRMTSSAQIMSPENEMQKKAGLGIIYKRHEAGDIEIIGLRPGGSADKSGSIFVGNFISTVGPIPVWGASKETISHLILGSPGTRVTLGLVRKAGTTGAEEGQDSYVNITLVREYVPNVGGNPQPRPGFAGPSVHRPGSANANIQIASAIEPWLGSPCSSPRSQGSAAPSLAPVSTHACCPHPDVKLLPGEQLQPIFEFVGQSRKVALRRASGSPGQITGVGISFHTTKVGGHMMITKLAPNGPADLSQELCVGDIIHAVNNIGVQGKRVPEVVTLIQGPPASVIVLTLQATSLHPEIVNSSGSMYSSTTSHQGLKGLGSRYDSISCAASPASSETPLAISAGECALKTRHASLGPLVGPPSVSRHTSPMLKRNIVDPFTYPTADAEHIRVVRIQRQRRNQDTTDNQAGVGMGFQRTADGHHIVCEILPGGAAAQSCKVFVGDRILSVDGVPIQNQTVKDVSSMIAGTDGTGVALTLERLPGTQSNRNDVPRTPEKLHSLDSVINLNVHNNLTPSRPRGLAFGTYSLDHHEVATDSGSEAESKGTFVVGMILAPRTCVILGVDQLMDKSGRFQGQDGYENQEINIGDTVIAIGGKSLKSRSSEQVVGLLSGSIHSHIDVMVSNTSSDGEEMFTAILVRNMPSKDHSQWSEYISSPMQSLSISPVTSQVLDDVPREHAVDIVEPSTNVSLLSVQQKGQIVSAAAERLAILPRQQARAMKLTVRVLEANDVAVGQHGTVLSIAKLRLLLPDEGSNTIADVVPASAPGQTATFADCHLLYTVKEDDVEQTQLELMLWDQKDPDDGFLGEVS